MEYLKSKHIKDLIGVVLGTVAISFFILISSWLLAMSVWWIVPILVVLILIVSIS